MCARPTSVILSGVAGMKTEEREKQMVSLVAAFALMGTMMCCPLALIGGVNGAWSLGFLLFFAVVVSVGIFALAVLFRVQKLESGESIFSGRFGLAIAGTGVVLLLGLEVLMIVALFEDPSMTRPGRVLGGIAAGAFGLAYLARVIYRNLTGTPPARSREA